MDQSNNLNPVLLNCQFKMDYYSVEPLLPTVFPDYPWQKVGVDLFAFNGSSYLLLIDYY